MDFRILGFPEVVKEDVALPVGGRKELALLALLVVNADQVISVDRMADELWGGDPPRSATKTVRSYISRLRRHLGLGGEIETRGSGYLLSVERGAIDAARFEDCLESGLARQRAGAHMLAAEDLAAALAEWRGPALAGLEDHDFAQLEAARLEARRLEAIEARIASDLELGRHRRLVAELEQLVATYPLGEAFWRYLMLALYRSGRQAEALRTFQEAKRRLGEELGIEPSSELRELEELILLQDAALAAAVDAPDLVHKLPVPRDSFVGREAELAEICRLITDFRCVTLTGVGGSGKTRLGIEAARSAVDAHPDGSRYVELATIDDPDAVAEQVLLAFGEPGSHARDPAGVLVEVLRAKDFLLVLDNCEHLIGPVAQLADRLLDECPRLSILATSREDLGIAGEAVFRVPALTVPEPGESIDAVKEAEATQLLVDRVRAHLHEFSVDEETSEAVSTVCRTLDGIPLAIELAAARMRTMSVDELAARIDDRLSLLTKGARTAPPRQQTLRATIEWSYGLLTPDAQRVFRRTGVFSGPWTMDAAHAVTADGEPHTGTVELIGEMVGKSLVERASSGRYRLLETIRQFAFEQLVLSGEAPLIGRRHRDWYLETALREDRELRGSDQKAAWTRLEQDHDNLRTAIRWSLESGEVDGALELVGGLGYFWMVRGYWREAWRWLERGLAADGSTPLPRARAIAGQAITEVIRVNYHTVEGLLDEAMTVFNQHDDRQGAARVALLQAVGASTEGVDNGRVWLEESYEKFLEVEDSWSVAFIARYLGSEIEDENQSVLLLEESCERFAALGDGWNGAFSLYFLSSWYESKSRFSEADDAAWKARNLSAEIGDIVWHAHATRNLGLSAYMTGDYERAKEFMEEALDRLRLMGDDACSITLNSHLAFVDIADSDTGAAVSHMVETMRAAIRLGATLHCSLALWRAAKLAVALGDVEHAVRLATVADGYLGGKEEQFGAPIRTDIRTIEEALADSMDAARRAEIAATATGMSLEEALGEALQWCLIRAGG
jgi:predicted ATPase/DNA-binding SARP family transcriptional activator